eukprot:1924362-Heterocapsa_arctica.AAC.1
MQLYLLVLALMGLEDVDADVRAAGRLLLAAQEGRARALQQLLSLPMWPGYSEESGTRLGIASVEVLLRRGVPARRGARAAMRIVPEREAGLQHPERVPAVKGFRCGGACRQGRLLERRVQAPAPGRAGDGRH